MQQGHCNKYTQAYLTETSCRLTLKEILSSVWAQKTKGLSFRGLESDPLEGDISI